MKIYANAYVSVEFMKGLKYKLNLTPDFQFYRYNSYLGLYDYGLNKNDITQVTEQQTRTRNVLVENLLTFDRTFGDHKYRFLPAIPTRIPGIVICRDQDKVCLPESRR